MLDIDTIFPHFTGDDREQLASVTETRRFEPGTVLLSEGEVSDSIYLITDGLVTVTKSVGASEIVVAELCTGDVLGEVSFVDNGPVSATVTTTTEVEAMRFPKAAIQQLAEASPRFGMRLYSSLASVLALRLRQTTDQYMVTVP